MSALPIPPLPWRALPETCGGFVAEGTDDWWSGGVTLHTRYPKEATEAMDRLLVASPSMLSLIERTIYTVERAPRTPGTERWLAEARAVVKLAREGAPHA